MTKDEFFEGSDPNDIEQQRELEEDWLNRIPIDDPEEMQKQGYHLSTQSFLAAKAAASRLGTTQRGMYNVSESAATKWMAEQQMKLGIFIFPMPNFRKRTK